MFDKYKTRGFDAKINNLNKIYFAVEATFDNIFGILKPDEVTCVDSFCVVSSNDVTMQIRPILCFSRRTFVVLSRCSGKIY